MSSKIVLSDEVVFVLDNAVVTGNQLVLVGQLDRKLYMEVNKTLEALGGKWNKSAKAHVFASNPREAIDNALLTGSVVNMDKELSFFTTPLAVAKRMRELSEDIDVAIILEPSAGDGAIINAFNDFNDDFCWDVCEIDDTRRAALANMDNVYVVGDDFMKYNPTRRYKLIVANPPFDKRADLEHVTHMWELLASGGRLVTIMAAGVKFRDDNKAKAFKELIPNPYIEDLPTGSFKESGTMVNAVIFVADKPL